MRMGRSTSSPIRSGGDSEHCSRHVGADLALGRKLPRLLREAGLVHVAGDAYFPVALQACMPLEIATVKMIRGELMAHGVATADEIDLHLANVTAGRLDLAQPPMISAWGRRP